MKCRLSPWLVAGLMTVFVGCDRAQHLRMPASPSALTDTASLASDAEDPFAALLGTHDPAAVDLLGDLQPRQAAEGHGTAEFVSKVVQWYSFSFTAQRDDATVPPKVEAVEAKGQFEYHAEDKIDLMVHGEVVCLTVIKNTAVIGGVITRSDTKLFQVGDEVFWDATDNGEGDSNQLDTLTPLMLAPKGGAKLACLKPMLLKAPTIKDGNIQVPWVK